MRRRLVIIFSSLLLLLLIGPLLVPVRPLPGAADPAALADADSRFLAIDHPGLGPLVHHYQLSGSGTPQIVLLHGFTFNLYSWNEVQDELATLAPVVAYDRVPFGLSAKPRRGAWTGPSPYTPAATEAQLLALLDELAIERAVLVGNSAGGLLAARTALAHPERVSGLVLVNAAILTKPPDFVAPLLRLPQIDRLGPFFGRSTGRNADLLRRSYADPARITSERERLTALMTEAAGWDHALWDFMLDATRQPDISAELGQITVPTLVILGAADVIVPLSDGETLAAGIPNGELVVLDGCGHVPQEECPEAFTAAFEEWYTRRITGDTP